MTFACSRLSIAATVLLISLFSLPGSAPAITATEQLRATVGEVLVILQRSSTQSEGDLRELQAQLTRVIYPRFDFREMAQRSLGADWAKRSPDQQQEFVQVFTAFLGRAYMDNLKSYKNQNIRFTRETKKNDTAEVETQILAENATVVSVNYRLHWIDEQWKVYDMIVDDISVISNYRSQFARIISRSSFDDLLQTMKQKLAAGF